MADLAKAIRKLKPTAEFSFTNDDYSTIKWDVLEGQAPTQSKINEVLQQLEADELAEAQAKATAKAALLAQLGITEEQAKLLLS